MFVQYSLTSACKLPRSGAKVSIQGHTPRHLGWNLPPLNLNKTGHVRIQLHRGHVWTRRPRVSRQAQRGDGGDDVLPLGASECLRQPPYAPPPPRRQIEAFRDQHSAEMAGFAYAREVLQEQMREVADEASSVQSTLNAREEEVNGLRETVREP
eukprot:1175689-Prorocentrum_minimum.AAC.1